jgi:MarR family 2-MHQ and catechol resistance regulon transcriptional repressor
MEFQDPEHEALVSVWWTGALMKKASRRFFKSIGTTESEFNLLMVIKHSAGPLTQSAVGRRLMVDKSNVTGLLDRMEASGLIRRKRVKGDRRSHHVELTAEGRRLLEREEEAYYRVVSQIMSGLSGREHLRLIDLTRKLRAGLARM